MRERRIVGVMALGLVAACGGEAAMEDRCAAKTAECLVNQQVCVDDLATGPRCAPCAKGSWAAPSGRCEALEGTATNHEFAEFTVQAGQEVLGLCQSWTLGNATELWVNGVELEQDESSHHSNWTFVPANLYAGPDGVWKCKDRGYTQTVAALSGGVLYAQSTQAAREVQKFPTGAAVRIPPYARIIGDVHLLNATTQPVTGRARLSIYSIPKADVKVKLVPFHFTYDYLDIPPRATSRFVMECDLEKAFMDSAGKSFAPSVYYALPHTHALGTRVFMQILGGPEDGKSMMDVRGFNEEARGFAYRPPVEIKGARGFRFGCEFTNPRDVSVKWGFGDQEMCEMLGFADAEMVWESVVHEAKPAGMDGAIPIFTGACQTLAVPWDHNKPGGPPP